MKPFRFFYWGKVFVHNELLTTLKGSAEKVDIANSSVLTRDRKYTRSTFMIYKMRQVLFSMRVSLSHVPIYRETQLRASLFQWEYPQLCTRKSV